MSLRPVISEQLATPTMEGAGVKLHRAFGFQNPEQFDPFLLFDDFRNDRAEDFQAGFPWHPHRGIETITYVLNGTVDHGDSLGNEGTLGPGSVQWMTAGSGILHQEMPKGNAHGQMHGFQLWANLPSALKMTAPRYQDIQGADIPVVVDDDGTRVKMLRFDKGIVFKVTYCLHDFLTGVHHNWPVPCHRLLYRRTGHQKKAHTFSTCLNRYFRSAAKLHQCAIAALITNIYFLSLQFLFNQYTRWHRCIFKSRRPFKHIRECTPVSVYRQFLSNACRNRYIEVLWIGRNAIDGTAFAPEATNDYDPVYIGGISRSAVVNC